jgi:hypothetical protein
VLDFGLVRGFGEDSGASVTIGGTPDYMSPEQARLGPLTEASDWYAVGVMLYQALAGTLPFTGTTEDVFRRKQAGSPRPPDPTDSKTAADLTRFCLGLLEYDPAIRLQVATDASYSVIPVSALAPQPSQSPHRPDFVGRSAELGQMEEAFSRSTGQLASVHVSGPSGVGKTLLVREFLSRLRAADPSVLFFTGRCFSTESVPYKGIDDLVDNLTQYLRRMPKAEMEQLLPRNFSLLTRLFPVLGELRVTDRRGGAPPDSVELRSRAFAALTELLGRIAERHRVVLAIDDLQWGDLDGCAFLQELIESPEAPALLLVLAYRSEDIEVVSWLKALRAPGATSNTNTLLLDLKGLAPEESAGLARVLIGSGSGFSDGAVKTVVEESGGDPFLVHEITLWLKSSQAAHGKRPQRFSIQDALRDRCGQLGTPERQLLQLVAVASQPIQIAIFKNSFLSPALAAARDALFLAHLLRSRVVEGREEVEVYHDRIREAVIAMLSEAELSECHQQLASALEAFGGRCRAARSALPPRRKSDPSRGTRENSGGKSRSGSRLQQSRSILQSGVGRWRLGKRGTPGSFPQPGRRALQRRAGIPGVGGVRSRRRTRCRTGTPPPALSRGGTATSQRLYWQGPGAASLGSQRSRTAFARQPQAAAGLGRTPEAANWNPRAPFSRTTGCGDRSGALVPYRSLRNRGTWSRHVRPSSQHRVFVPLRAYGPQSR